MNRPHPPFRTLRRALLVHELRHLTRAAESLERSQSAVTRSLLDLERFLGCELFERRPSGMISTCYGNVFFPRVRAALEELAAAEHELRQLPSPSIPARGARHLLELDVANVRVLALLAVFDHRDVATAAAALDMEPKSLTKTIRALELQLGAKLFERAGQGTLAPTEAGRVLAVHLKRALAEIRAGLDELESLGGGIAGEVRVGLLPAAGSLVIVRAVDVLHERHPDVAVAIRPGSPADLELALRCGDIDVLVGTLGSRALRSVGACATALLEDRIEVLVRAGHPLAQARDVSLEKLLALDWILPPRDCPLRTWFCELLARMGLREPRPYIETDSLAVVRSALLGSQCVALGTRLACWHEIVESGVLVALPISALTRARVEQPLHLHLARREKAALSPAAEALCTILADVAATLGHHRATTVAGHA